MKRSPWSGGISLAETAWAPVEIAIDLGALALANCRPVEYFAAGGDMKLEAL
jgi:hypothetical protein